MERLARGRGPAVPDGIEIRSLRQEDIEAVVAIESEAFTTPWQASTFEELQDSPGVELMVMTDAEQGVIGYAVLWVVMDQGELANLALTTNRRGAGLGAHLLQHVLVRARDRGVKKLFLEVRASNERAIELYHSFGFEDVGLRRDYYDRPREDARLMLTTFGR